MNRREFPATVVAAGAMGRRRGKFTGLKGKAVSLSGNPLLEGSALFRIVVESVLPGEGCSSTIYGCFLGATDGYIWRRSLHGPGAVTPTTRMER